MRKGERVAPENEHHARDYLDTSHALDLDSET